MSDREAFVAAIAANPADDLPRLVFADWLDEHGEAERAEFIRTQIRLSNADVAERKQLDLRARELFREHWQHWFGPFILAMDPSADLGRWYQHTPSAGGGAWLDLTIRRTVQADITPVVRRVDVCRGFVQRVDINVHSWGERGSLAEAFQHESPHQLACQNGLHSPVWVKFTDPALRRVSELNLFQPWAWDVSAPESTALLEDPHLAGVRTFGLFTDLWTAGRPTNMLPVAWLERFVRSSLAYRLNGLSLSRVPAGGTVPLCRPGRLILETLFLRGELTTDDVRRLGASELSRTLTELSLQENLDDATAATLARDDWSKLRALNLRYNRMTAAVLPALAAAAFIPQLKELDLSGNPLFTHADDEERLRPLADALDPDRLERLDLTDTGLSHVPDFLAERFGDRVVV
jgi:uncharacterized protein (TIGR02996 family)